MKSIELKASLRTELGKKDTMALRRAGQVPCVMYGGETNIHFAASANDFRHIIYSSQVFLVKLDMNGKQYQAVLKDMQFHPVSDQILHMDFIQVFDDKPVVVDLPITVSGTSKGILAGGKLRQRRRYLKVKGLLKDLPENLVIDITPLRIGSHVKVEDLKYTNLELLDPAKALVLGIAASRVSKGGAVASDEEEEGAEAAAETAASEE